MKTKSCCPECGSRRGVKEILLLRSKAYLCPQEGCSNFDQVAHTEFFGPPIKTDLDTVDELANKLEEELDKDTISPYAPHSLADLDDSNDLLGGWDLLFDD